MIADVAPDGTGLVKAFNTTFAGTLLAGAVDGRRLDAFIAGDDDDGPWRSCLDGSADPALTEAP